MIVMRSHEPALREVVRRRVVLRRAVVPERHVAGVPPEAALELRDGGLGEVAAAGAGEIGGRRQQDQGPPVAGDHGEVGGDLCGRRVHCERARKRPYQASDSSTTRILRSNTAATTSSPK